MAATRRIRLSGTGWWGRGLVAAAVVMVVLGIQPLLGGPAVSGSIKPHSMLPAIPARGQEAEARPLAHSNHLDLPADSAVTIEVDGLGVLRAVGPAAFELDRSKKGWKLVLLRGEVTTELEPGAQLELITSTGRATLREGLQILSANRISTTGSIEVTSDTSPDRAAFSVALQDGYRHFYDEQDFDRAAQSLMLALQAAGDDLELKKEAMFYLSAALFNGQEFEDAARYGAEWLELAPESHARDLAWLFQGLSYKQLGRQAEAIEAWRSALEEGADETLEKAIRLELDQLLLESGGAQEPEAKDDSSTSALWESGRASGNYLVLALELDSDKPDHDEFRAVAHEAARFHNGAMVELPRIDWAILREQIEKHRPENLLVVLPPEVLDVNLHRRLVLLSTKLDADLFPDFGLGYFTARNGDQLRAFWDRTRALHEHGLSSENWNSCFVTSGGRSQVYPDYTTAIALAAGFQGESYGFAIIEEDPQVQDFIREKLPELEQSAVITIGGNGDPQGVWLFDDHRNIDSEKHWAFDPDKVGHDPDGSMPRIMAESWRELKLARPIVWSGTCHSAATHRVYVEGDIVSTFGMTDTGTIYAMPAEESMGLALIEAGAGALLAPIASNHGYATLIETDFALQHGASLGEILRATWSDIFLQVDGDLELDFQAEGKPIRWDGEDPMRGGGINRILIGDPALAPFSATEHPLETTEWRWLDSERLEVRVKWQIGFHAKAWDMFGTNRVADYRITARVPVARSFERHPKLKATVEVVDENGERLPFLQRHAELEQHAGEQYLHLQANVARKPVEGKSWNARFEIRFE